MYEGTHYGHRGPIAMRFESLSQVGQDKFAYERIGNSGEWYLQQSV
jgi:hypothetical protein